MNKHIIITLAVCLLSAAAWGQKKPTATPPPVGNVLTKQVTRQVFIADTTDYSGRKLRPEGSDTTLAEFLFQRIKRGQLTAYAKKANWSTPTTGSQLNDLFKHTDTIVVTDPVTGATINKVTSYNFNFEDVHYYNVLEEWRYNKQQGTTDIQIIAIAPMHEAFTGSHSQMPMFWIKFGDVKKYLATYQLEHPNTNLQLAVWNQYFNQTLTKN